MAWEWSHTQEAYQYAKQQLSELPRETLNAIFAEWRASQDKKGNYGDEFDAKRYDRALAWISDDRNMDDESLAQWIWDNASDKQTCDNGGWNALVCPYGCGCHVVPFCPEEED